MADPEVWLRGVVVPGVPALLQPVAHSLLQCREEVLALVPGLTPEEIWMRPGGAASIGFHVRHAGGSLDRLFTYARNEPLSAEQLAAFRGEAEPDLSSDVAATLTAGFDDTIARALEQLRLTGETTLAEARRVGRAGLPSTVVGLLFHGAEHTQRHVGQLTTTVRIVRARA